ncbi:MAG: hypothetical protein RRY21_01940 [Oscillospiraceae bacterium]
MKFKKNVVVCGHYGAGKTNLAVNLALAYVRTADFKALLGAQGVDMLLPMYANSNLDLPVVPPGLEAAIRDGGARLVLDVGGDDAGAIALGRYAAVLEQSGYTLLYVVNRLRYAKADPEEELELLRAVERCARLSVTGLVNNTNLGVETAPEHLRGSLEYLEQVSQRSGLPVLLTAACARAAEALEGAPSLFPVEIYVKTPW